MINENDLDQTLKYLCERLEKQGISPPGFKEAFEHIQKNPRRVFDLASGIIIGTSAAIAWGQVFGGGANVGYLLFPKGNHRNKKPVFNLALALTFLPEIIACTDVSAQFKRKSPLAKFCKKDPSCLHITLVWLNRLIVPFFLAKFFKIYYEATWGNPYPELAISMGYADYWLCGTYLWSNFWKKHDLLKHKIHLIEHVHSKNSVPDHNARVLIQNHLSASYRHLQMASNFDVLQLAIRIHKITRNIQNTRNSPQAMLSVLSCLYDEVGQASQENIAFTPQEKPNSLKKFERAGQIFGTLLVPSSILGAYFTWDSILELLGARDENWHTQDKGYA